MSIDPVSHNDSGSYACFIVMGDMKQAGSRKVTVRVSKDNPRVVVTPSEDRVYVSCFSHILYYTSRKLGRFTHLGIAQLGEELNSAQTNLAGSNMPD